MDRITAYSKLNRIKWLIEHKSTGTPKELAKNLGVSERTIYRLLQSVQDLYQIEITYSYLENSYVIYQQQ